MTRLPISVCMISGAEAGRIGRALQSVAEWTREIIVVLNEGVADGTEAIARAHGAWVYREPWKGHIAQKNSAAQKAGQPWILGLDADEAVSPELRRAIQDLFAEPRRLERHAAYSVPRLTWFCGRWIRHGDWYPDRKARLWRSGLAEWGGVNPHDKLQVRGTTGRLRGALLHFNADTLDHQVAKIPRYSDDFVRDVVETGRTTGRLDLALRPWWRFFRGYVLRRGFLDGWQGYYIAWMTAFYTVHRYAKVLEARQNAGSTSRL